MTPQKTSWSEYNVSELNTLGHISPFIKNGWAVVFHDKDVMNGRVTPMNPPQFPVSFKKGTKRVWRIKEGWQVADFIDNKYCNHSPVGFQDVFDVILIIVL